MLFATMRGESAARVKIKIPSDCESAARTI